MGLCCMGVGSVAGGWGEMAGLAVCGLQMGLPPLSPRLRLSLLRVTGTHACVIVSGSLASGLTEIRVEGSMAKVVIGGGML